MGGAVSAGEDNEELVDNLVEADYIKTPSIEKALRAVDRGNYYLDGYRDTAYKDVAWKNGNLHLSAPCIYSEVLECLQLSAGQSFLNLGSGTGYLSTVAGLLLGSYGVNHGVEQHADVVEYATERLNAFLLNSPALDMMDFCQPTFIVGNCLQLEPSCSVQAYDRVYCGAGVPTQYLTFIRNIIKIGGIVVMPSGDQLLQMRRLTEDTYEIKNVLPVSFATLVEPTAEEKALGANVVLPDRMPLKLQEICRTTVRSVLRGNAENENPDFKMRSVLRVKRRRSSDGQTNSGGGSMDDDNGDGGRRRGLSVGLSRRRQRIIRRILIPVFPTDSDDDDSEPAPDLVDVNGQPVIDEDENESRSDNVSAGVGREPPSGRVRNRSRQPIIAIGTAGLSATERGGGYMMRDLHWDRFLVGEDSNRSADETSRDSHHERLNDETESDNGSRFNPPQLEEDIRDSLDAEQQLLLSGATFEDGHGRSENDDRDDIVDEFIRNSEPIIPESPVNAPEPLTPELLENDYDPKLKNAVDNASTVSLAGSISMNDDGPTGSLFDNINKSDGASTASLAGSIQKDTSTVSLAGSVQKGDNASTISLAGSIEPSISAVSISGGGESSKRCLSESEQSELEARRKSAKKVFESKTKTNVEDTLESFNDVEMKSPKSSPNNTSNPPPCCRSSWQGLSSDQDSDASDSDNGAYRQQQRRLRHANVAMQRKFSKVMKEKIDSLPVPDSIKLYLSYYRK